MEQAWQRRQLKTRDKNIAKMFAAQLSIWNISANLISVMSIVFSAMAFTFFSLARENSLWLLGAVAGIQLRLLCNLMDGMVAIENKRKTDLGDLFNEIPDRITDTMIIFGAGFYLQSLWSAAVISFLSLFTAYLRMMGAWLTSHQVFDGPQAKQHRMFLLSVASLMQIFWNQALVIGFGLSIVGLVITIIRRVLRISKLLKDKNNPNNGVNL